MCVTFSRVRAYELLYQYVSEMIQLLINNIEADDLYHK